MKKALVLSISLIISNSIFAQNEIGPDGDILLGIIATIAIIIILFFVLSKSRKTKSHKAKHSFIKIKRIQIELEKDRIYLPDILTLKVKNTRNTDIDIERPLLIFDNFWIKRKFRIKGTNHYKIYPLYLESKKSHALQIDLNGFYQHDKKLKNYPKAKIIIYDVKGKRLGSTSVYLRKTLFKF